MKNNFNLNAKSGVTGKYRFLTYRAGTKELLRTSEWIENLVMKGSNTGVNLVAQRLIGLKDYDLEITEAKIGDDDTAPTDADTDLLNTITSGILRANQLINNDNEATILFFISSDELPDGDYKEFGLFCDSQLFARSIISPTYSKAASEDTVVEYVITIDN